MTRPLTPPAPLRRSAGGGALTVEEWLAARRVVEERRAVIWRALQEQGAHLDRGDPPCPIRVMTEAERNQRPRALVDTRVAGQPFVPITAGFVDVYRAKRLRRDE